MRQAYAAAVISESIQLSALLVELYIGLTSFYEIFNPWEMNLNIPHLPLLNFSETVPASSRLPVVGRLSRLRASVDLPFGSYLFIGPSFLVRK